MQCQLQLGITFHFYEPYSRKFVWHRVNFDVSTDVQGTGWMIPKVRSVLSTMVSHFWCFNQVTAGYDICLSCIPSNAQTILRVYIPRTPNSKKNNLLSVTDVVKAYHVRTKSYIYLHSRYIKVETSNQLILRLFAVTVHLISFHVWLSTADLAHSITISCPKSEITSWALR